MNNSDEGGKMMQGDGRDSRLNIGLKTSHIAKNNSTTNDDTQDYVRKNLFFFSRFNGPLAPKYEECVCDCFLNLILEEFLPQFFVLFCFSKPRTF